jgi:hypothetical protein
MEAIFFKYLPELIGWRGGVKALLNANASALIFW